jgi:hypothetical protein
MGARWYARANGQFTSRDNTHVNPDPNPAAANPCAYAADNPLTITDPTGQMPAYATTYGTCNGSGQYCHTAVQHHQQSSSKSSPYYSCPSSLPGCPGYHAPHHPHVHVADSYINNRRFGPIGNDPGTRINIHLHGGWTSFFAGVGYFGVSFLGLG